MLLTVPGSFPLLVTSVTGGRRALLLLQLLLHLFTAPDGEIRGRRMNGRKPYT